MLRAGGDPGLSSSRSWPISAGAGSLRAAGPSPAVLAATLLGLACFGAALAWFGVHRALSPDEPYMPARVVDGRIVPGHSASAVSVSPACIIAPDFLADPALAAVLAALPEARVVGGAVRDALAGRPVADIDLATPMPPEQVIAALRARRAAGRADRARPRHRDGGRRAAADSR